MTDASWDLAEEWVPDGIVVCLADLLHHTGCTGLDELSAVVDSEAEVDMSVHSADGGIAVATFGGAIGLEYPFTVADLWEVVAEAEADEVHRWEAVD